MTENKMETELVLTIFNWEKAEEKIRKHKAPWLDEVPVRLIDELGPKCKETLLKEVERILKDRRIPDSWLQTRMNLIYKGKGDKDRINR